MVYRWSDEFQVYFDVEKERVREIGKVVIEDERKELRVQVGYLYTNSLTMQGTTCLCCC